MEVTKTAPPATPTSTPRPGVGDVVKVGDQLITLQEVKRNGTWVFVLLIENKGNSTLSSSSLFQFEARDSQGNQGKLNIFGVADIGSLDKEILPGDRLRGAVAFTFSTAAVLPVRLYYRALLFTGETVVFEVQ